MSSEFSFLTPPNVDMMRMQFGSKPAFVVHWILTQRNTTCSLFSVHPSQRSAVTTTMTGQ